MEHTLSNQSGHSGLDNAELQSEFPGSVAFAA